jgi:hypothetical protein
LKRALHVVDGSGDPPAKAPLVVSIGGRLVSVVDTGNGAASLRFVDVLLDSGAARADSTSEANIELHILIRDAARSPEARVRAETLEQAADVVLGSARLGFARHLASACARWVNS